MSGTPNPDPGACQRCGCTDEDCVGCILKTGRPCYWLKPGLCDACATPAEKLAVLEELQRKEATS